MNGGIPAPETNEKGTGVSYNVAAKQKKAGVPKTRLRFPTLLFFMF